MSFVLELPALKDREFALIRDLAYERFGLQLSDGKRSLVSSRLAKLMRNGRFASFAEYCDHVLRDPSGEALVAMIDCLTTNHTSFLREPEHFRFLAERVWPEMRERRPLRIWSAACSTGEEPYSILFSLLPEAGDEADALEIRATDISTRVLELARAGVYPSDRLAGMPLEWSTKYFRRMEGGSFQVRPQYGRAVRFERINLIEPFRDTRTWPVIFCRNVMIYFDRRTRAALVQRLAEKLEPGGYLFVGHAESLIGIDHALTYVRPAVYRKPLSGGRA